MRKFIVERPLPGIGTAERRELEAIVRHSNAVLGRHWPEVQWVRSFVAEDKTFCVYIAENEDILRGYVAETGFPADSITEIRSVIDPTTAGP